MNRLTLKQQKFVEAYIQNGGNGGEAVFEAGYDCTSPNSARSQASDNLRKPNIRLALEEAGYKDCGLIDEYKIEKARSIDGQHRKLATREDRAEFLTKVFQDDIYPIAARLRAVELLGKMYGDFLDRLAMQKEDIEIPVVNICLKD